MLLIRKLFLIILIGGTFMSVFSQVDNWSQFVALESTRVEVERVLGKPDMHFEGYGVYRTDFGRFHIWYSLGGCDSDIEGLQYDIPAQRLTRLFVYPRAGLPLTSYVADLTRFVKSESLISKGRFHYTSLDDTIVYETILPVKPANEFVYSITIQPGKRGQDFLCKQRSSS